ncbi:MAG: aminodeoxychorismate synthase component I [Emcibacteraceae bacterium]|nr:aminodeoxychorismate synthase component I [Emcibacteraceae bacterium]
MGKAERFSLFLEDNRNGRNSHAAYYYQNPIEIITARTPNELAKAFENIQTKMDEGFHVAGWISYEAGCCLEEKLHTLIPEELDQPLLKMGVFKGREIISSEGANQHWRAFDKPNSYKLGDIRLNQSFEHYKKSFSAIQDYLKAGDIYQANYTMKAEFDFSGSTKALYAALRNAQQVEYGAFIESDDLTILSLSPELFIRKAGESLTAKPMKGTGKRGRFKNEDDALKGALYNSEKDRAENLMIVDLLRNDLSKKASKGSVSVSQLFEVEKYKTLFTMTSTIEAQIDPSHSPLDVMTSIFPCGSITGAPKIRAQEIIDELEDHQRGIYTGAIGYFTPQGDMCFSVPIRTMTINKKGQGELGLGGAIVADSNAEEEYNECLLKASFVTNNHPRFDLIESLKYSPTQGYPFLEKHLERLNNSANYYLFNINIDDVRAELVEHAELLNCNENEFFKVRLLLSKEGNVTITSEKIIEMNEEVIPLAVLSSSSIDSENPFYFHKTTERNFYQSELAKYRKLTNCFDVIFLNEKKEVTEGSFTNIFIKKDGLYYTPPIECGLLPGIYRDHLLDDENFKTIEKKLKISDLKSADEVYLCNSVRGLQRVNIQLNID